MTEKETRRSLLPHPIGLRPSNEDGASEQEGKGQGQRETQREEIVGHQLEKRGEKTFQTQVVGGGGTGYGSEIQKIHDLRPGGGHCTFSPGGVIKGMGVLILPVELNRRKRQSAL